MNQKEMVLVHMKKHGGITAAEAMNFYGIARLSARIWDLRRDGIRIITDKQKSRNRYGRAVVYDRYRLGGAADVTVQNDINVVLDGQQGD